jgi:hypothetical protein
VATKQPIIPKRLGLRSDTCLTAKDRQERTQRHERRIFERDAEWRREARREPERQPIDRTALESEVIAKWSRRMYFEILKAIRGKPTFCLIPQEAKQNGKTDQRPSRFAPIRVTSFAALMAAFSEREARHAERSET